MRDDPRFSKLPCVREGMRFYAGVPLLDVVTGQAIGALCLVDESKRHLDDDQRATFKVLAKQAMFVIQRHLQRTTAQPPPFQDGTGAGTSANGYAAAAAVAPSFAATDDACMSDAVGARTSDTQRKERIAAGRSALTPEEAAQRAAITKSTQDKKRKADNECGLIDAAVLMRDGLPADDVCVASLTRTSDTFDEQRRLAALMSYGIVASEREESMNALARMAADICEAPIAAISLVYPTGNLYKAAIGMPPECHPPRATSFCAHAIRRPQELLISEDCRLDDRFKHNPMVTGEPFLRSYVAAPLIDVQSGQALGTICMADIKPRKLTELQKTSLLLLSKLVMTLFAGRRREMALTSAQADAIRNLALAEAARQEADDAIRAKASFLSSMSHEIRTPLNAVLGVSTLLEATELSMEQHQYISMINTSGQMLLSIVNDILDYSKLEAGEVRLHLAAHNVADIVESVVMQCYGNVCAKGLTLTWLVNPSIPPTLLLDGPRLQQILLNLLSNAIKFTKPGGRITIDVAESRCAVLPTNQSTNAMPPSTSQTMRSSTPEVLGRSSHQMELRFEVRDTGIGISTADLATLFRSFSQVRHSSGEYGGTGLGLVISERLVTAMGGGKIKVDSVVGRGSTFSFCVACLVPAADGVLDAPTHATLKERVQPVAAAAVAAVAAEPITAAAAAASLQNVDLLGLSALQRAQLARLTCVFIGDQAVNNAWARLLVAYGCRVHSFTTTLAAAEHMRSKAARVRTRALSVMDLDHALRTICDIVIVDLDTKGVHEETVLDSLALFSPVRLLFTYSHAHLVQPQSASTTPDSAVRALLDPSTNDTPCARAASDSSFRSLAVSISSSVHHFPHQTPPQVPAAYAASPSTRAIAQGFISHSIRQDLPKPFKGEMCATIALAASVIMLALLTLCC